MPPAGAAATTRIPATGADGVLQTPNRNLTADETVWHFRAALNVAALNCIGPSWAAIATNYNMMLNSHKAGLSKNNLAVDALFRKRHAGAGGLRVRDTKMTELFNYFALPPVHDDFCNVALKLSTEAAKTDLLSLDSLAGQGLGEIDQIFVKFFHAFNQYEARLKEWNSKNAAAVPADISTGGQTAAKE